MKLHCLIAVVSCLSISSLLACTIQQKGTPATGTAGAPTSDGGLGLGQDSQPAPAASSADGLSCLAIVQCITECAQGDMACPDACGEKGSPDGKAKILAFAECIDKEKCTDETCLQTKCKTSLEACVTSSAPVPSGKPLEGSSPPGNVPADLVGSFVKVSFGSTTRLTLNSDGTGTWQLGNTSTSTGCTSSTSVFQTGNAVVDADKITIYATDVSTRQKICTAQSVTEKGSPATVEIKYTRKDENTLSIIESACAARYADSEYSQGVYCSERLVRE